jgi:hypothetical protein
VLLSLVFVVFLAIFETILLFMCLDICNFITVYFIYSVYPCLFETTMRSIYNCGFSILSLAFVILR